MIWGSAGIIATADNTVTHSARHNAFREDADGRRRTERQPTSAQLALTQISTLDDTSGKQKKDELNTSGFKLQIRFASHHAVL